MLAIKEYIKQNYASDNRERSVYAGILDIALRELGEKKANELFQKAEKEGKFLSIEHEENIIDGGKFVITDLPPF